jgi:hypothetical protein
MLLAAGARVEPAMADWEASDDFQAVIDQALRDARRPIEPSGRPT